jgi:hypothetical protein
MNLSIVVLSAVLPMFIGLFGVFPAPAAPHGILGEWTFDVAAPKNTPSKLAPFYLSLRETSDRDTLVMIDSVTISGGAFCNELRLPIRTITETREQSESVLWIARPTALTIDVYQKSSKPEYDALTLTFELSGERLKFIKTRREFGIDDVQIFYYRPYSKRLTRK